MRHNHPAVLCLRTGATSTAILDAGELGCPPDLQRAYMRYISKHVRLFMELMLCRSPPGAAVSSLGLLDEDEHASHVSAMIAGLGSGLS